MGRGSRRRPPRRTGAPRAASSAGGAGGAPPGKPKPRWREFFDAWGGLPVFGSIAAVVVLVGVRGAQPIEVFRRAIQAAQIAAGK